MMNHSTLGIMRRTGIGLQCCAIRILAQLMIDKSYGNNEKMRPIGDCYDLMNQTLYGRDKKSAGCHIHDFAWTYEVQALAMHADRYS